MKRKRHIRRTISKTRRLAVRQKLIAPETKICEVCEDAAPMLEPDQIREKFGISERVTFRFVEKTSIHFQEGADKKIYVCLESLRNELERETGTSQINFRPSLISGD